MKKKKNNMMVKAGKIYYTLCHAKDKFEEINNKKMSLNCDRARIALCDIMKGMKTETVKPSNKIIISTNIYTKGRLKIKREIVIFSLYKEEEYECEILAMFDYALSDLDMRMLVDWLCMCAKEDPDKVITFLEEYRK